MFSSISFNWFCRCWITRSPPLLQACYVYSCLISIPKRYASYCMPYSGRDMIRMRRHAKRLLRLTLHFIGRELFVNTNQSVLSLSYCHVFLQVSVAWTTANHQSFHRCWVRPASNSNTAHECGFVHHRRSSFHMSQNFPIIIPVIQSRDCTQYHGRTLARRYATFELVVPH